MIWDFVGRRPLPVRDYVVSIEGGPKLWNHVLKDWQLLVGRDKTDEKLENQFFRYNFVKHEGVGGSRNLKNHWISPTLTSTLLTVYFISEERPISCLFFSIGDCLILKECPHSVSVFVPSMFCLLEHPIKYLTFHYHLFWPFSLTPVECPLWPKTVHFGRDLHDAKYSFCSNRVKLFHVSDLSYINLTFQLQ